MDQGDAVLHEQQTQNKDMKMEDFLFGANPLHLIIFSGLLIVAILVAYIVQSGLFAKITVKTVEPKRGSMTIAYKIGRGPYKNCGELFTDICSIILDREHLGIYYDDPDNVAPNDLRYAVGVILASGNEQPDPQELELVTKNGYKIAHFPKPNHVVLAEFPFRNTLSIYLGIFRVYPKLKEYIATRALCAYPALEIYTSNSIEFIMPLSKQEEFFVPEFCEEQVSIATTEFSNHPDLASAEEELKNKSENDDQVFVKPAPPVKLENPSAASTEENKNEASSVHSTDDDSSEFEKIEPEN